LEKAAAQNAVMLPATVAAAMAAARLSSRRCDNTGKNDRERALRNIRHCWFANILARRTPA